MVNKVRQKDILEEKGHIFLLLNRREKEGEKKRVPKTYLFDLRSFVEPIVKVHLLDKGYAWVPKKRDFTVYPKEEILGNQVFQD